MGLPDTARRYFHYTPPGLADTLSKLALPLLGDGCSKAAAYSLFHSLERLAADYSRGPRAPGALELPLERYTKAERAELEAKVRKGLKPALVTLSQETGATGRERRLAVAEVVHVAGSSDQGVAGVGWGAMESLVTVFGYTGGTG